MNEQPNRILAAFAVAWRAIARAFTTSRSPGDPPGGELDTTLFGALPEDTRVAHHARDARKDDFWNRGGESSYFADADIPTKNERR